MIKSTLAGAPVTAGAAKNELGAELLRARRGLVCAVVVDDNDPIDGRLLERAENNWEALLFVPRRDDDRHLPLSFSFQPLVR